MARTVLGTGSLQKTGFLCQPFWKLSVLALGSQDILAMQPTWICLLKMPVKLMQNGVDGLERVIAGVLAVRGDQVGFWPLNAACRFFCFACTPLGCVAINFPSAALATKPPRSAVRVLCYHLVIQPHPGIHFCSRSVKRFSPSLTRERGL